MGCSLLLNNYFRKKLITMPKTDTILSAKSLRYFLQLVSTMNYTQAEVRACHWGTPFWSSW